MFFEAIGEGGGFSSFPGSLTLVEEVLVELLPGSKTETDESLLLCTCPKKPVTNEFWSNYDKPIKFEN